MKRKYKELSELLLRQWWIIVAIAMLATFSLTLYMGMGQSIWFDEGYSILLAERSFADLIALTNVDAHPPLYYVLLKIWAEVFGWSELALRSFSAVLAAGVVAIAMVLIRTMFTARIAITAMPLLIAAPFLLRYGYEVRMYALASLIGILATYVFVRAVQKGANKRTWLIYGLLVALGMYTLYMTLVIWLAHLVWLVFITKPKKQLLRHPALIGYGAALVLFLPQLPIFIHQTIHSALPGVGTELTLTKLVSVIGVLSLYTPEWQIGGWLSLLLIAVFVLFGMLYASLLKQKAYRLPLLVLATLVVVPLVFYAVTSLPPRKAIFIERYMAHVSIYFYMLVAVVAVLGFKTQRKYAASTFMVFVVILMTTGLVRLHSSGNLNLERMQLPETRELKAGTPCDTGTTIVADDPYTYIDSFYYFDSCNLVFYNENPLEFKGGYAPLQNGHRRVSSAKEVSSSRLVHLYWDSSEQAFSPQPEYKLITTSKHGKQMVAVYERSE